MKGIKKTTKFITSIDRYDRLFFPKTSKKNLIDTTDDPKIIGAELAKKSIKKIVCQLGK